MKDFFQILTTSMQHLYSLREIVCVRIFRKLERLKTTYPDCFLKNKLQNFTEKSAQNLLRILSSFLNVLVS